MSKYGEMTLGEYVEDVFFPVLKPDYKPKTVAETQCAVRDLARCCKADLEIDEITIEVLQKAADKKCKPLAKRNARRIVTIMRTVAPERFPKEMRTHGMNGRTVTPLEGIDGPLGLLAAFYKQKYEPIVLRSRSQNTKRLYKMSINLLGRFLGRKPLLDDLNDTTVSAFASWRLDEGKARKTVNRDLCCLLAMWRWANRKGYLDTWPDVQKEKVIKRTPRALTREELLSIFRSIQGVTEAVGDIAGPDFWRALFLVCWDTGERIGAVMAVKWSDVDLGKGWITFLAEHRKGGRSDNTLPLASDTIEALNKIKRLKGKVFLWPYNPGYIFPKMGQIMVRAGLPDTREFKFHAIRKSTASYYEAAGGNATELLGHSSRDVTKNYLDPRVVSTKPAVALLFRPEEPEGAESA